METAYTMETMGRHVISELWGCDFEKLNNIDLIEKIFVDLCFEIRCRGTGSCLSQICSTRGQRGCHHF